MNKQGGNKMLEEEISKEEKNYFRNLEKKFHKEYNKLSDWLKEVFDRWVLENAEHWLDISGFNYENEEDKNNFLTFIAMFSLIKMKPDDDLNDFAYVSFIIKQAEKYVKYKKERGDK
jgi:hypothetical protein